jgi:hypothetical protein
MTTERYRLSFTAGGLFVREAPTIVERYLQTADWVGTRSQVRTETCCSFEPLPLRRVSARS